jgi:hypothetical protein
VLSASYYCPILMNLEFSLDIFSKSTQISNFRKILLVGVELFHVDGRTDMTKLAVAFRNFANANKKHPNFETEYFQLCITTLWLYVTNEQICIVISLTFS